MRARAHGHDDDDGSNGNGCYSCREDIAEIKALEVTNLEAIRALNKTLDTHVKDLVINIQVLITILEKKLDSPWAQMNRMIMLMAVVMAAFVGFVFIKEFGVTATKEIIESIKH